MSGRATSDEIHAGESELPKKAVVKAEKHITKINK